MATPVIMPKFGMVQTEGTVIRWLKAEGDVVQKGETLLEVQTDKVDMEVESPASGILTGIVVGADSTVPVTTLLAYITAPGELPPARTLRQAQGTSNSTDLSPRAPRLTPVAQRLATEQGVDVGQLVDGNSSGRITKAVVAKLAESQQAAEVTTAERRRATPAARRLARESALSLETIAGTGPQGRIQAHDVTHAITSLTTPPPATMSAVEPLPPTHLAGQKLPLQGMRKTIATRLTQSWQTIPHIMLTSTVNLTQAEQLRQRLGPEVEKRHNVRLTPTVLLAKAVAAALIQHPRLNQWLVSEEGNLLRVEQAQVNLGIAVALADGLIVPVIKQAERLGLAALAGQVADLAQRARAGQLHPDEVADGTFTISNLGMFPVDHFTALINPPQVAILAVGQMQIAPLWDGQAFQPTPQVQLTLSVDHRAVDGAVAAAFLTDLKALIEEPARLLL